MFQESCTKRPTHGPQIKMGDPIFFLRTVARDRGIQDRHGPLRMVIHASGVLEVHRGGTPVVCFNM
jgi:hypothetical protein